MKLTNLLFTDRSLFYKFLVLPSIPVVIAVMFIITNILNSEKEILIEEAKNRASLLAQLSTLTVSNDYVIYNKALLDEIVDNLTTDESVVYAIIMDSSDNRILAHNEHEWDGRIMEPESPSYLKATYQTSSNLEISNDINIGESKFGVLKVGYTLEGVHQEIVQLKKRLVYMVSIALFLGGCSSIILALLMSRPITALVEQTKIIGAGNFENKVVYQSKDILGQLANEFNKMVLAVKTKQQETIDSETRLQRVVENMPVMMEAIDENYKIIAWNRECERVTGYSAKEMIGNPNSLQIIYPDADYRKKMQAELANLGSDFRNKEFSLTSKDGTEKTISWSNISARFPIPSWYSWAIGVDVTERKQAEIALKKSETNLARAQRIARIGNWSWNIEENRISWSKEYYRIVGLSPKEFDANYEAYLKLIHPDDLDHFKSYTEKALKEKKPWSFEYRIVRPNGEIRIIHEKGEVTVDTGGNAIGFFGTTQDVTQQKKMEAALKASEEKIRQSQRMESIGNLAGGIAHDFNNILASIMGYTELVLLEVEKDSKFGDSLQEVYAASKRAKDLVKQILAFARQSEEEIKPVQPSIVAKEVLKFIRSSIPSTIEVKVDIKSDSFIMGNATQIHQILMNLFTNAAYAMENDGGLLEVSLKDSTIADSLDWKKLELRQGNYLEIKVSDTGTGISPEIIESVFEPYFTTKGTGEGTGLGLAVVQGIVETYGGKITVDSILGKGTTFAIYLPITKKHTANLAYKSESLPTGAERILLVDDEGPIVKMNSELLERLGYSVTTRTSSIEAMELFRSKPEDFDLIITDMTMPNMTGDLLAIELIKIRPDIPVILCTGYSKKISEETASEIGINAFMYKPITMGDMAKTVRKVLDETKGAADQHDGVLIP